MVSCPPVARAPRLTPRATADIVTTAIRGLDLNYPEITPEQSKRLDEARAELAKE